MDLSHPSDRKIVVAVDFGTTFSGLAWAQTRKPELQTPIVQWPDAMGSSGLEGITSDKVPTELSYENGVMKWGYQIGENDFVHKWFKLRLDPSRYENEVDLGIKKPGTQLAILRSVPDEKLIIDYLSALQKHATAVLKHKLPESAIASTPLEFVITVPAIWSAAAQDKTRKCAEIAGMGHGSSLHMISEPEAAATYALDPWILMASKSMIHSCLKPLITVVETGPGSGSKCGSTFLNQRFQQALEAKFLDDEDWDHEVLEEAMQRFEKVVKPGFNGNTQEVYTIPVPGIEDNPALGVRRGKLRMTGAEIAAIFRPVVQEVVRLVLDQIRTARKKITAILLVGGFGQSAFLRDQIRAAVGKIPVMQSPNGWTAVVRGALMRGLAQATPNVERVSVTARTARMYYGVTVMQQYDPLTADVSHAYWSSYYQEKRINAMDWFIKKGNAIEENKPVRLSYWCLGEKVSSGVRPSTTPIQLYVYNHPTSASPPAFAHESGVKTLVQLTAELGNVPARKVGQRRGNDGEMYWALDYEIQVTHYSASTSYDLIVDGVNYGSVSTDYA